MLKSVFTVFCILASSLADADPLLPGYLTDPSAGVREAAKDMKVEGAYETPDHLKFPYVSTYYVKPLVVEGKATEIRYFVTDWDSSKIRFLDGKFRFDVYLEYAREGEPAKRLVQTDVKSGDGAFDLGQLPVGDYGLRLWAVDRGNGLESHRVVHEFRVVTAASLDRSGATYAMTEKDLSARGISNCGATEKPVCVGDAGWQALEDMGRTNLVALQKLLDEKAAAGIRRLVMLPGVYRLSASGCLQMPDDFELDLNGATLKENGFTGDRSLIVNFPSVRDSHLVNGTLEGDFHEHDYKNSPHNSEWPMGFCINGDSRYCTVSHVTVKDVSGYGAGNGIGKDRRGDLAFFARALGGAWTAGSLDVKSGEVKADAPRFTSDYQDLRVCAKDSRYVQISKYLGYQGCATRSWFMTVCWYDDEKRCLSSETAFQYRAMLIPEKARYLRVSMEVTSADEAKTCGLYLCLFRVPWNCSVVGCTFDNCRAVGYAASAMKNCLFGDNVFTRCGHVLARCAFDAEDGWDQMQDAFFVGNVFKDNPNNHLLTCAGHNFVFERNSGDIFLWGRTYSPCVRDNDLGTGTFKCDSRNRSGYGRFQDNRCKGILIGDGPYNGWDYVLSGIDQTGTNSHFGIVSGNSARIVDCTFRNSSHMLGNAYRCRLENCKMAYLPGAVWRDVTVRDSTLQYLYKENRFVDCLFERTTIQGLKGGHQLFERCGFDGSTIVSIKESNADFFSCDFRATQVSSGYYEFPGRLCFRGSKIFADRPFFRSAAYTVGGIGFDGCTFSGKGPLVDIFDLRPQSFDGQPGEIAFTNCTFGISTEKPIVVTTGNKLDATKKNLRFTVAGCRIPTSLELIAEQDKMPDWEIRRIGDKVHAGN